MMLLRPREGYLVRRDFGALAYQEPSFGGDQRFLAERH